MNSKEREKPYFCESLPHDQSALALPTAPLRTLNMETESKSNTDDPVTSQGSNKKSD